MTPLHSAAKIGHIKVLGCLVEQGADINIQADNGVIICDSAARVPDWVWGCLISRQILYPFFSYSAVKKIRSLQALKPFAMDIWSLVFKKL